MNAGSFLKDEGVDVRIDNRSSLTSWIDRLENPWIADEGQLDAKLHDRIGDRRANRGMAFDATTTVYWDDDAVTVVFRAPAAERVLAFSSPVLLRRRRQIEVQMDGEPVERLARIDYYREGRLAVSRFLQSLPPCPEPTKAGESGHGG